MRNFLRAFFLTFLVGSCGMPPEGSLSDEMYKQCVQYIELMEQFGGNQVSSESNKLRDYCSCQAKIAWRYEEEYGISFAFNYALEVEEEVTKECDIPDLI